MTALRSSLFLVGGFLITAIFGMLVPAFGLFSYRAGLYLARSWARWVLKWAEWSCGIRHEVRGMENVPARPAVIMSKHQSAWETLYIEATFPYQCWIIKRELLWLPFVGWGLAAVRSIAIDRSSGVAAREQIVQQGAKRIAQGLWVSIFPEGTRVPVGKRGRYGIGGATLATRTGAPILPIAHNAGEVWGRYAFRKRAGTVQVVIGPVIETAGRDALSVNREVEAWIEGEMRRLNPERYADA
ncbi:MAG TPA: lysophospholipid acyltransferase family protein [Usitatibacteraceae bacterium]|nr:lysophospholipid acyltransferase family protein [Usitatibacteraceae bacterium]